VKLVRWGEAGAERPGLVDADGRIRDVSRHVADIGGAALSPTGLAGLAALPLDDLPPVDEGVRLGPCVGGIGKILCIGLNYSDHAAETRATVPPEPILFMKPTSAVVGPNDDVRLPRGSTKTDWEVELAIVIGARAKYVPEEEAPNHIAGWCILNDVSEREYQLERHGTWDKGKGCDTFAPVGPWLVTRDELPDVSDLKMWLAVNGRRFQDGTSATMVYKPAFLVSYLSRFMTLHPGDVIATGTPPGVGMGQKPPVFLNAGDVMELGIERLGTQRQAVVAD
jgi:2,4-diketo-3-deoxy-L-fuconate hydrolase